MTEQDIINVFSKMRPWIMNGRVTYKKALKLTAAAIKNGENQADYYKVVTRKCEGDHPSNNGASSLPTGCTDNLKDSNGKIIPYLYDSPKGTRVRFWTGTGYPDEIRYFVKHQEVDRAFIEDLYNNKIVTKEALKDRTESDHMVPYLSTVINVTLVHKSKGQVTSVDIGDANAFQHASDYHENLK